MKFVAKLTDLNPSWLSHGGDSVYASDEDYKAGRSIPVRERVGVEFDCPCGNRDEYHRCFIEFKNPPDGGPPCDPRAKATWHRDGDTFETLSLSPSIQRTGDCKWHGYITKGEVLSC
jgi:hypothetical protein